MGLIRLNSERIREQAKAGRWSSHSIAAASGGQVSQPTVSKLMSNRDANPAAIKLKKVCDVIGLPIDDAFVEDADKKAA